MKPTASRDISSDASHHLSQLLARCSLGDQAAFAGLYEATSAKLFGVALRILRREAWAEEALQEAYVKIWRHAESYNPARGRPLTSMNNIVRNQAPALMRRCDYRDSEDAWDPYKDPSNVTQNPTAQAAAHPEDKTKNP